MTRSFLGKRKRPSTPILTSHIARRLAELRKRHRDLWADDSEEDEIEQPQPSQSSKSKRNNKASIALTDSEEEVEQRRSSSRRRSHTHHHHHREISARSSRSATCLICSVLSQLSSRNCCSKHLAALQDQHEASSRSPTALPNQVMIIPVTDDIIQRYLNPDQIHRLRRTTASPPIITKTPQRRKTVNGIT